MLKFGFTEEESKKFKQLVVALAENEFKEIDIIVEQFSSTDEERFDAYLEGLQQNDIPPNADLKIGSFVISMFEYYRSKQKGVSDIDHKPDLEASKSLKQK